ncbi:Methyltransf-11 domain-containing protein [Aphelenchoides fujianensis]|nr:Methyltransf-11 domain-containing protein [Aphelenchoides fujianensis]
MTTTVRPTQYLSFWKKYSGNADIQSMMASDHCDILSELPDFTNQVVVDVGAGIGRFTSTFAERAKLVISTDFIDSFIEKNRERNARFHNIEYQVNDAANLELEAESTDLLFTNWLLMYLRDEEVVNFLQNALKWLKEGGFLHLRESCTESTTGAKSANGSLHQAENNPTHYRHASVYIQLLREIRWRDAGGRVWKFDVRWAHSVPTYVEKLHNWRQVHWLVQKKAAAEESGMEHPTALLMHMLQSHVLQNHTEFLLDDKTTWTNAVFGEAFRSLQPFKSGQTLLAYSPRLISPFVHVDPHSLAKIGGVNVWTVEQNPYFFSASLTKANRMKNTSVRYAWNQDLNGALDYWQKKGAQFDGFVSTELLISTGGQKALEGLKRALRSGAHVFLLEPAAISLKEFEERHAELIRRHFELISITDVSDFDDSNECQRKQRFDSSSQGALAGPTWFLVHARLH